MNGKSVSRLLIWGGVLFLLFGVFMDTSVDTSFGDVVNVSLVARQQMFLILGGIGLIGGQGDRFPTSTEPDAFFRRLERLGLRTMVMDHQSRSPTGELERNGASHPASRSRDQTYLVFELHGLLLWRFHGAPMVFDDDVGNHRIS